MSTLTSLPPDEIVIPPDDVDAAAEAATELMSLFRRGGPAITKKEAVEHLKILVAAVRAAGGAELAARAAGKSMRNQRGAGVWIYDALEHAAAMEDGAPLQFGHAHTIAMLGADPAILDCFFG